MAHQICVSVGSVQKNLDSLYDIQRGCRLFTLSGNIPIYIFIFLKNIKNFSSIPTRAQKPLFCHPDKLLDDKVKIRGSAPNYLALLIKWEAKGWLRYKNDAQ